MTRTYKHWTKEEKEILVAEHPDKGVKALLVKLVGRTAKSINMKALRLGVKVNKAKRISVCRMS